MPELSLDDRDRNALHQQLVGHRVAQPVRVDALLDTVVERYEETEISAANVGAHHGAATVGNADATGAVGGTGDVQLATTWLLEDGPLPPEKLGRGGAVPPLVFSNSYLSLPALGERFLAAGASTFVGPLIPLYSRPARKFVGRFYSFLADGLCTAAALRAAALSLREQLGPEHPAWLSYGITGYGSLALPFL